MSDDITEIAPKSDAEAAALAARQALAKRRQERDNRIQARDTRQQSTALLSKLQGGLQPLAAPESGVAEGIQVERKPSLALSRIQLLEVLMFSGADRFRVTLAEEEGGGIGVFFTDHPLQGYQVLTDETEPESAESHLREERMEEELIKMFEASMLRRQRDRATLDHDLSRSASPTQWDSSAPRA